MGAEQTKDSSWRFCLICDEDGTDWIPCFSESPSSSAKPRRRALDRRHWDRGVAAQRLEDLTQELFRLHDLDGDGVMAEQELIRLNQMIAQLHNGKDVDTREICARYKHVFRSKLDSEGHPVAYGAFRAYAREVLEGLDTDPEAQEMIMEQFIAEARAAREVFQLPSPCGNSLVRGSSFGAQRSPSFPSRQGSGLTAPVRSFSFQSPSFTEKPAMKSLSFAGLRPATSSFVDPSIGCAQFSCPGTWPGPTASSDARSAAMWIPGAGLQQPHYSYSCTVPMGSGASPQVLVAPVPRVRASGSPSFQY